jgi:hypothetical protein
MCISAEEAVLLTKTKGKLLLVSGNDFEPPFRESLYQWFSTFLTLRHTNFIKKFGGTPKCNKRTKMMKNDIFCILYMTLYDLAAHLEGCELVRRGTPVEKHCSILIT